MDSNTKSLEELIINKDKLTEVPENCYSDKAMVSLANGFVSLYQPSLTRVKKQLNELVCKQEVLIEQLHNENLKLSWSQNSVELQEMFNMIKEYHTKLLGIRKDMRNLHERSAKLKKRTARLQQHLQKEAYIKHQQLKLEQDLISKSDLPK